MNEDLRISTKSNDECWEFSVNGKKRSGQNTEKFTHSQMQMICVRESLKFVKEHHAPHTVVIDLACDCDLIPNTFNLKWKKKANKDLWKEIEELASLQTISWRKK